MAHDSPSVTSSSPPLCELQQLVWKLITAPEGVEKALQHDPTIVVPIRGDHRLSAVERLDIYANMYFYRIRDSLKEDFPAILALLGDAGFHNLITDYLLMHPSQHWTLRNVGIDMAAFLGTHPVSTEHPFIADLARFEWELIDLFDAATAPVLTQEGLAAIPPDAWAALCFRFVPSLRQVAFAWPIDHIRGEILGDEGKKEGSFPRKRESPEIPACAGMTPQKTNILFWQHELKVLYRRVELTEQKLICAVTEGKAFSGLCEIAAEAVGIELAVSTVSVALQSWLQNGMLCTLDR